MTTEQSVKDEPVFSTTDAGTNLSRALAIYVGRGRRWSYEDLSAASGVNVHNIRAYSAGTRSPTYSSLASLIGVLGGEFATRLFMPVGVGAFDIPEPGEDDTDTVSMLADAVSVAAKHRRDRKLNHVERAVEARDLAPRLITEAGKMIARAA